MTKLELPDVYEGMLDALGVEALFRDLTALDTKVEILVKRSAEQRGEPTTVLTLHEAQRLLTQGEVRALQLRYEHESKLWCDTLSSVGSGTRIVRMALPTKAGPEIF